MASLDPKAATKTDAPARKIPVTVLVGKRMVPGSRVELDGCWSIGRKFTAGQHELEVTPEQLKELKHDESTGILSLTVIERKS